MTYEQFEIDMYMRKSFAQTHCELVEDCIRLEFPKINNLSVNMNEDGTVFIVFDETIYTQDQVQDFVNKLKSNSQ